MHVQEGSSGRRIVPHSDFEMVRPADPTWLVGVWKTSLIVRIGPDEYNEGFREPHVREFDVTRRPMRGWEVVEPDGIENDEQLSQWIERATKFVKTSRRKEPFKKHDDDTPANHPKARRRPSHRYRR